MKRRDFKWNLSLPDDKAVSLNLARLGRYIKNLSPSHDPAKHLTRRRFRAVVNRGASNLPGRRMK